MCSWADGCTCGRLATLGALDNLIPNVAPNPTFRHCHRSNFKPCLHRILGTQSLVRQLLRLRTGNQLSVHPCWRQAALCFVGSCPRSDWLAYRQCLYRHHTMDRHADARHLLLCIGQCALLRTLCSTTSFKATTISICGSIEALTKFLDLTLERSRTFATGLLVCFGLCGIAITFLGLYPIKKVRPAPKFMAT